MIALKLKILFAQQEIVICVNFSFIICEKCAELMYCCQDVLRGLC